MKKICLFFLCLLWAAFCTACNVDSARDAEKYSSIPETQTASDADKYIIQTPYYQIYEEDLQTYRYRIASGKTVLAEDVKTGTEPTIEEKGDGILKLHLGFGTNAFSVQYFDMYRKTVSEKFSPYSVYADYINTKTKDYYIAYFQLEENPKLYINGFFESAGFSVALDLDFAMVTCEKIIFLNESELYIEYTNDRSENVRKVINYKE